MSDLIRNTGAPIGPPVKDKLGSPSTESEDGVGDLAEMAADMELDEADGPSTNGLYNITFVLIYRFLLNIFNIVLSLGLGFSYIQVYYFIINVDLFILLLLLFIAYLLLYYYCRFSVQHKCLV